MLKKTTDGLKMLERLAGPDPRMQEAFEVELLNREVASEVYKLRTNAGLSQAELARRIGTTQSVISRLEDSDYSGHSLTMLNRIAEALGHRVAVRFVPRKSKPQVA